MKLRSLLPTLVFGLITSSHSADLTAQIDSVVADFVRRAEIEENTPGMAVLVSDSQRKKVIYETFVGLSDLKAQTPIGPHTPFRLGSVTKPMTAAAIQQLHEQGRLEIHGSAQGLLPDLTHDNVTFHHLLSHSAGFQEYTGFQFLKPKSTNVEIIEYLERKRLRFEPGEEREYSNTGYAILASAIKAASGVNFATYLKTEIFEPQSMTTALVPGLNWRSVPERAIGYNRILWQYLEDDEDFLNGVVGDRGVYGSVMDLDQWMTAYFDYRIVSKQSVDQALRA
ncbi:MAG: serine hydrolase domain-containing protein, partial [Verrucomicrobiota bacterium]